MRILLFLAVLAFLAAGVFRGLDALLALALVSGASLLCLALSRNAEALPRHILLISLTVLLFVYTLLFSPYIGRSAVLAVYCLSAAILFITLDHRSSTASAEWMAARIDTAKVAFLLVATLHAFSLIFLYLFEPVRMTGLMEDYSQASLFILFAFGMTYPMLREKSYFAALCLILFVGFFTTFSRTSNTLLLLFFLCMLYFDRRQGNLRHSYKAIAMAAIALAFVYIYPSFVEMETVDRGGISHLGTLNSRTIYWGAAWEAIQQKPWIGHGLGNYEWTGIKEVRPFRVIHHIHNDYLQIWHDLGIIWLLAFVGFYARTLLKYSPWQISLKHLPRPDATAAQEQKYLAWSLLFCLALYMAINFAIVSLVFQVGLAILFADLLKDE